MPRPRKTIIEYRRYELPLSFPVLLLEGDRWHISDVKSENLHFHNCLEIGMCHTDSGTMIFEGESMSFRAGDVTCVPRHVAHTTYSASGTQSLWTYIFVDLSKLLAAHLRSSGELLEMPAPLRHSFRYLMNRDEFPKIHFLVSYIIDELHSKKENYQSSVGGLFIALYLELLRVQEDSIISSEGELDARREYLSIRPALSYIHQNYMNQFSVERLAGLCHLSATHFRRAFLSIMGESPLNFISITRVEKACYLLQTTDKSILSVSESVGFSSVSSFNRYFKRIMGISPRDYRASSVWPDIAPQRKSILQYSGWL